MKSYVFPGIIEDEILQIGMQQIPYMRTAAFSTVVKDCEKYLLQLIGCTNGRVIPYTASGTAAMDAIVANYITQKKKTLVIAGGSFGYRWKELCCFYNCKHEVFEVPFAQDINYDLLAEKIEAFQPEALLCQHHETSTGQLFDLEKISLICQKHKVSLIVDAISSFLADPLDMDKLKLDACIISSQKGLNIPPGLSLIILSEKMLKENFAKRSYYLDFEENLKNLERGQTPYSPATILFLQLHARLEQNIKLGASKIIENTKDKALYFRKLCKQNGWEIPAENPSNSITGFFVHRNGDILFSELLKKNIQIMPGGTPHYFRVSHLGLQTYDDLEELANAIKEIEYR